VKKGTAQIQWEIIVEYVSGGVMFVRTVWIHIIMKVFKITLMGCQGDFSQRR